MSLIDPERLQRRVAIVDEHIRCENQHDLDAVMATFGNDACYDDEPWADHRTGRKVEFPLCGIFEFDADDRLAGERIYYDRGAVLGQLGMFHEPMRGLGRVVTALTHPVTVARAYLRRTSDDSNAPGPHRAA